MALRTIRTTYWVFFAACVFASSCGKSDASEPEPSWLFTFTANGVSTFDAETQIVSLSTSSVVAFSDRPYRLVYAVPPAAFANLWTQTAADSFTEDPPNAVMTFWDNEALTGTPQTVVFEITNSVLYVPTTHAMSFGINLLESAGTAQTLPTQMYGVSVFVDNAATDDCSKTFMEQQVVEVFNEIIATEPVHINVAPGSNGAFNVSVTCASEVTEALPPDLRLSLTTPDRRFTTTCAGGAPIVINAQSANCDANRQCEFLLVLDNRSTLATYGVSSQHITVNAAASVAPDLEPLQLPYCIQNANQCLVDDTCTISGSKIGVLRLCESSSSCG